MFTYALLSRDCYTPVEHQCAQEGDLRHACAWLVDDSIWKLMLREQISLVQYQQTPYPVCNASCRFDCAGLSPKARVTLMLSMAAAGL